MSSLDAAKLVFVVEDDDAIRTDLKKLLAMEGYEAVGAENGLVALELLKAASKLPDLILLDIMMPLMDGWQFRAAQAQDPTLAAIPVVVMTADGHASEKAAKMQAQGYLRKPIDLDYFLDTVSRLAT